MDNINLTIKIKILNSAIGTTIPLPQYATKGSAGLDLRACINEPLIIKSNTVQLIPSGIAIHISDVNYAGIILPRSGLGHKHGIILGNSTGLIDSDYQGELLISCWNRSSTDYTIEVGEKIAQLVLIKISQPILQVVDEFDTDTDRSVNGFGHSGKH